MRLPHHGSAATQTAVRILADVKNCLSAQSAMKAAAAAQDGGTNNVRRPPSPDMQRMHVCTPLQHVLKADMIQSIPFEVI